MKHMIHFTAGYVGYFLIGYMALRAIMIQDDIVGFIILSVGSILLLIYMHFLEQKNEVPKYRNYIKLVLAILFITAIFNTLT